MYRAGMSRPIQFRYTPSIDALILGGIEFDTVAEVSTQLHTSELYGVPDTDIWRKWRKIALRTQPNDPYKDINGRMEAFWRTMVSNQMWDDADSKYIKAPSRFSDQFRHWLCTVDLDSTTAAREAGQIVGNSRFYDFINNVLVGNQARLFRTEMRYLGLACQHIRSGDKVVILWGGHLPHLLRECESKRAVSAADVEPSEAFQHVMTTAYRLVRGQIYVHGIIEAEEVDLKEGAGFQSREFCIV